MKKLTVFKKARMEGNIKFAYEYKVSKCHHYYIKITCNNNKPSRWLRVKKQMLINLNLLPGTKVKVKSKVLKVNLNKPELKRVAPVAPATGSMIKLTKSLKKAIKSTLPDTVKSICKPENWKFVECYEVIHYSDLLTSYIQKLEKNLEYIVSFISKQLTTGRILQKNGNWYYTNRMSKIDNKAITIRLYNREIIITYLNVMNYNTENTVLKPYLKKWCRDVI